MMPFRNSDTKTSKVPSPTSSSERHLRSPCLTAEAPSIGFLHAAQFAPPSPKFIPQLQPPIIIHSPLPCLSSSSTSGRPAVPPVNGLRLSAMPDARRGVKFSTVTFRTRSRPVGLGAELFLKLVESRRSALLTPHRDNGCSIALVRSVTIPGWPMENLMGHPSEESHVDEIMCRLQVATM